MDGLVYTGDAGTDGPLDHGWLIGHFKPAGSVRHSDAFEVKWGQHPAGDRRTEWVRSDQRLTTMILISGRFVLDFAHGGDTHRVILDRPGAYVVWEGVDHTWHAPEATVILTVRAPSIPGYQAAAVQSVP
ncbi:hypothetical protein LO763_22035 [Glycomyces sp. A-F 0318]|uniref:hypothetical protein n=1 Tax=Glycomyces amatae TaxID=2881355 RepID=UPI001E45C713|nr:hypothetical protein [Glycomyces amatae]MCD0446297.1 hypothetical protein [Glycomyces amatae]